MDTKAVRMDTHDSLGETLPIKIARLPDENETTPTLYDQQGHTRIDRFKNMS